MKRYNVLHLFCGIGGGALGFKAARPRFGDAEARFDTLLGVDFDPQACADFERLTGAPALCADVAELQPHELRAACGGKSPDVVFLSAPCKGFSSLLPAKRLAEEHYQKLNRLMVQGLWLVCETWPNALPKLIVSENVPRIQQRGADTIRRVKATLAEYGYRFHEGAHDCGEIGGLAQRRKRWLLVARHEPQVPTFLYEPPIQRVRGIGEVIDPLPMPDDARGGAMHRTPKLQWKTWVRLALIPAGQDWRALGRKADGPWRGTYGIVPWDVPAGTVTANGRPGGRGVSAVADPRVDKSGPKFNHAFRVVDWSEPSVAVASGTGPSSGGVNVADPRFDFSADAHRNKFRVAEWAAPASTIVTATRPGSGALTVADPRVERAHNGAFGVRGFGDASVTVTGETYPSNGAFSVADPRAEDWFEPCRNPSDPNERARWLVRMGRAVEDPRIGGKGSRPDLLGVLDWSEPARTISGNASVSGSNCAAACADPRVGAAVARLPADKDVLDPAPVIVALDGTWHRPLTTLELLVLQDFPSEIDGAPVVLDGANQARWRMAIGNAVPVGAARAVAGQMGVCLLAAEAGRTFTLGGSGIWVDRYRAAAREAAEEGASR